MRAAAEKVCREIYNDIMRRGLRGLGVAVWLGGVGGCVGEGNARAGSEDLGHRFAAAWVRVQAAFGDG